MKYSQHGHRGNQLGSRGDGSTLLRSRLIRLLSRFLSPSPYNPTPSDDRLGGQYMPAIHHQGVQQPKFEVGQLSESVIWQRHGMRSGQYSSSRR